MAIPAELIAHPQWVLWRADVGSNGLPTKVPYNPHTKRPQSVTDPTGFSTYDDVINGHAVGFDGQGIVATATSPYSYIDLDDPWKRVVDGQVTWLAADDPDALAVAASHAEIIAKFASYTEVSPSGRGARIVIRGKLKDVAGLHVGKVEVYSDKRFVTITGNHWAGTPLTIEERQDVLDELAEALQKLRGVSGASGSITDAAQTRSDDEVLDLILKGSNAADFNTVAAGGRLAHHPSDSEADLALADFISYFTNNFDQALRIFRRTARYEQRAKLRDKDEYRLKLAMRRAFDQKGAPVDVSALRQDAAELEQVATATPEPEDGLGDMPGGLLGFFMSYLLGNAPRPIPAFALAGSIGLLAGIAGRAYNVDGQGLNQYIVTIGESGMGKDLVPNGVAKLMHEVGKHSPSAKLFIGPDYIQSGSALIKQFKAQPSFVSLIGEFGKWLHSHAGPKAPDHKQQLMADLLKVYGRSGHSNVLGAMVYSDKDNNVSDTMSPALTLLGDTVPDNFYASCTIDNIREGTIPRFLLIEYEGKRPALNPNHYTYPVDDNAIQFVAGFCEYCHQMNQKDQVVHVAKDVEATAIFDGFLAYTDKLYNDYIGDAKAGIWSRAYLKALKLAALYAVGCDIYQPCINAEAANWAINLAVRDVHKLYARIKAGDVEGATAGAAGDNPKHYTIAKLYRDFVGKPYDKLSKQHKAETTADMHDTHKVMRYTRFRNICLMRNPWKNMKNDAARDFDNTMKELSDVFKVAPANAFNEGDATAMLRWNIHSVETPLLACTDMKALKRLLASEDDTD